MMKKVFSLIVAVLMLLSVCAAEAADAAVLENGVYKVAVESSSDMFKVVGCVLTAEDGVYTATITMSGTGYDKLYLGSGEDAAATDTHIEYVADAEGAYTFTFPVEALDTPIAVAAHSVKKDTWYDRALTFKSEGAEKLAAVLADGVYNMTVASSSDMFKVVGCVLTVESGVYTATITMSGTGYDKLYLGTGEEAAAAESHIVYIADAEGAYTFTLQVDTLDALIDVKDSARYLVVPENMSAPAGLDPAIVVLQQPIQNAYLAATSAMALFDALDALDAIRMVGTKQDGWYIENAVTAMEKGEILFAGKYSEPDFEMLLTQGCDLAIESMMITHSPRVKEMLELLGIPVFIDRSSYESHPLGRTEWIKLYAVMVDKEDAAEAFFAQQAQVVEDLKGFENTGKTVAFFYIHTDGSAVVRSTADYVPGMIEIAGGKYVFEELLDPDSDRSSISISMEEFYNAAVYADYLIYNATIDDPISSVEELLAKSALFADFKAVLESNVWCTGKYLYQATDIVGNLITDINLMLKDETDGMTFIYKLN